MYRGTTLRLAQIHLLTFPRTVEHHQSNYAQILSLRQTSAALDEQLKQSVQLLAELRRDIKAIPPHSDGDGDHAQQIPVESLLSYAKFISKTSVPPTLRQELPSTSLADQQQREQGGAIANGTSDTKRDQEQYSNDTAHVKVENVGLRAVDEQTKRNLDPLKDLPFEPWPPYAVIQQSALADIQRMLDAGKDPAGVLSAEEQAEAERRKQEEEVQKERVEQEQRERRRMSTFPGTNSRAGQHSDVFDPDEA